LIHRDIAGDADRVDVQEENRFVHLAGRGAGGQCGYVKLEQALSSLWSSNGDRA
jgi:hypothetical protein